MAIAEGLIDISPETTGFESEVRAAVAKATSTRAAVGIDADTTGLTAEVDTAADAAASAATASVPVEADASGIEESVTPPFISAGKNAAKGFIAAFGAQQVAQFIGEALAESVAIEESINKARVVFGAAADEVIRFGENSATSIGQSNRLALEATGTYGNLFRAVGLAEDASAEMSTTMVALASDLASFNNADPSEVLEALRAGLVGETEPLRKFGININDARLRQEALNLGLRVSSGVLDSAVKAQAAYSLILKDTSLAQGDFERTSEGVANQQRIASAQFSDTKAAAGELAATIAGEVLPAVNAYIGLANEAFQAGDRELENVEASVALLQQLARSYEAETLSREDFNRRSAATVEFLSKEGVTFGELGDAVEYTNELRDAAADKRLDGILGAEADAAGEAAKEEQTLAQARRDAVDAARAQLAVTLQLAGGFLGIQGAALSARQSQRDLAEAQGEVQKALKESGRGSKEYRDAINQLRNAELDAITSQIGLKDAVISYLDEVGKGANQREAIGLVRQFGRDAGLTRGQIRDLIDSVRDHIKGLNDIPREKRTRVVVEGLDEAIRKTQQLQHTLDGLRGSNVPESLRSGGGGGGGGGGGSGGGGGGGGGGGTTRPNQTVRSVSQAEPTLIVGRLLVDMDSGEGDIEAVIGDLPG